jgi:hypothetical protein
MSSSGNELAVAVEINSQNGGLELKKLKAALAAEKTMVYGKSWKLAGRRIKGNASGQGVPGRKMELNPDLRCYGFYASSRDAALNIPEASVKVKLAGGRISGSIFYDQAAFYKNDLALACTGISMFLPFGIGASEGTMEVKQVKLNKRKLGKVDAKIQYKDDDILIKANHFSKIFSNASLFFRGRLKLDSFPDWSGDFSMPEFKIKNPLGPGEVFPALKNIGLTGNTALEGHLEGDLDNCKASGVVSLNGGTLYFADWELSGVKSKCAFADLFKLKSSTRQKLYCKQLKNNSIELFDMHLEFEPHGIDELQIDRLSAKWFGGRLNSLNSFMLHDNNSVPEKVNFLASDITLSPFLEYLGIKGFVTDAVVGGIIPFKVRNSKVYISGASLATKASRVGFLRLDNDLNKYMVSGSGTSKAAESRKQFASAALKRFNYNWIRLNAKTTPEAAEISLSIDGYPEKALPFQYNNQKSMFESVGSEEPGINGDMTIETKFKIPTNID